MADLDTLLAQLDEVADIAREGDAALAVRLPRLSGWSVGQQLDHLLRAAEGSIERILQEPEPLARGIRLVGRVLLALRWFPRGVARSPKPYQGREISASAAAELLERVRSSLERLRRRPDLLSRREPVVPHPYFGGLSAARALRMVAVHTEHHLKIVRDLRRAAGPR